MVQLPSPRKPCAEQAAAAAVHVPPPPDVVKAEDGNVPILKRVKIVQQPALSPQYMHCNVLHEPGTLDLQLRKSPSLLDLIQTKLSQAKSAAEQSTMAHSTYEPQKKKEIKSGAPKAGERLKASNFPANFLKNGTWEYKSQYEGDLVAKCYFAKHKLVWEVLDAGLKSKIEIQWSDIIALKAICPEDGDGTLDMVLARPPLFFKETDPQPRKHTLWQTASDFTGGQASVHRRHILQCPTSLLSKNFEKLIQCDQRLNQLSQQSHTISVSPVFKPTNSIFENPNEVQAPLPDFTHPSSPCADSPVSRKYGLEDLILKQPQLFFQPVNLDIRANEVASEQKLNWRNQLLVPGLKSSMSMDDLVNHLGNVVSPTPDNEPVSKEFLEEIAQCLLSDTQVPPASDEKYLMARVNSLCCLLEKDTSPATIPIPKPSDSGCTGEGVNSDGFDEELTSASVSSTADVTEQTAILRKDSLGDLLLNLPRIASVQQLFEIPENSKNSGFCFWD